MMISIWSGISAATKSAPAPVENVHIYQELVKKDIDVPEFLATLAGYIEYGSLTYDRPYEWVLFFAQLKDLLKMQGQNEKDIANTFEAANTMDQDISEFMQMVLNNIDRAAATKAIDGVVSTWLKSPAAAPLLLLYATLYYQAARHLGEQFLVDHGVTVKPEKLLAWL